MPNYQDPKVPFVPDRTRLPIHEPEYEPCKVMFADENPPPPPPRFAVKAPEGAPNVLIVLIDDMGFGCSSTFGGPVPMPTAERLAHNGLRFNRFHTTSICAPTRAALLSGYNHHSVNMGQITELGTAYPGNLSTRPKTVTPMAQVLRMNGFATAQFGKCHEVPAWETSVSGPFEHWPVLSGFDKFYGFIAAETNQYRPALVDGLNRIPVPDRDNYHLSEDLADQCITWMRSIKALTPDKPFFTYFAPGATHAPHHAPKAYLDMFKGQFDEGWDVLRARTLDNMKKMGVVPADTKLAQKPAFIEDWDALTPQQKELYAREMEVYAGFARHTDDQVGRLVDALKDMGELDNTLIYYILGDNGASAEGWKNGAFNENSSLNGMFEPFETVYNHRNDLGTEMAYNHYAAGWAIALDSPFEYCKTVASNFGGTRNGCIVHYPAKYKANGEIRSQFHHVIDVAPTVYELCGVPIPQEVNGIRQRPMEGVSMKYAMDRQTAADRRTTQYFNVSGCFGVYHEGWFAGAIDKLPWDAVPLYKRTADTPWELYHVDEDFSMSTDLAAKYPDKLMELKGIFFQEGVRYNVFPMDPFFGKYMNADIAKRPTVFGDRKQVTLYQGMDGIGEHAFLSIKNHSFSIEAEIDIAPGHTDGVVFAQGGRFGGYSLYVKDGMPCFCYNWLGRERYYARASEAMTDERNHVRLVFAYDGGGMGKGGNAMLCVNNRQVAKCRIEHTIGNQISMDELAEVGMQRGTPVTEEYDMPGSLFQGKIYSVRIAIDD